MRTPPTPVRADRIGEFWLRWRMDCDGVSGGGSGEDWQHGMEAE
jgi:hypothetical protein